MLFDFELALFADQQPLLVAIIFFRDIIRYFVPDCSIREEEDEDNDKDSEGRFSNHEQQQQQQQQMMEISTRSTPSPLCESERSMSLAQIVGGGNCSSRSVGNNNSFSCSYRRPVLGHKKQTSKQGASKLRDDHCEHEGQNNHESVSTTSSQFQTINNNSGGSRHGHSSVDESSSTEFKKSNNGSSIPVLDYKSESPGKEGTASNSSAASSTAKNTNDNATAGTQESSWWGRRFKTKIHETPINYICILLFIVICGTAIAVCVAVSKSKINKLEEEALDLAIETGGWFSNQLDQAILPLFSMAQFTAYLDLFHKLPDQIGPADQPGSLPYRPDQPYLRNVTGVCDDPELVSRFTSIASGVKRMANMEGILVNIQLAPYGVVCLLHPMNNTEDFEDGQFLDNTGAWGLDLFAHPNFKFIATQSLSTDTVSVAGPITLIQCPTCDPFFIARLPIHDDGNLITADGGETYWPRWGFATALIAWSKLVDKSGIYESFASSQFEFQLTRTDQNLNADTGEYDETVVVLAESFAFAGTSNADEATIDDGETKNVSVPRQARFVSTTLETTNNEWVMTVQYDNTSVSTWLAVVVSASVVISFFLSFLVYKVLKQKQIHAVLAADTQAQQAMINTERNITAYFAHELRNRKVTPLDMSGLSRKLTWIL